MEFFKNVNVDWMGKAKYFVALSAILLIAGWTAILKNGGIKYGIDFRGGTLVYVRFAGPAPVDQIRKGLAAAGLADSSIQTISDTVPSSGAQNDVVIGLDTKRRGRRSRWMPGSRRFWTRCTRLLARPRTASSISIRSPRIRWPAT